VTSVIKIRPRIPEICEKMPPKLLTWQYVIML